MRTCVKCGKQEWGAPVSDHLCHDCKYPLDKVIRKLMGPDVRDRLPTEAEIEMGQRLREGRAIKEGW